MEQKAVNCGGMGMTVELRVGPGSDAGVGGSVNVPPTCTLCVTPGRVRRYYRTPSTAAAGPLLFGGKRYGGMYT